MKNDVITFLLLCIVLTFAVIGIVTVFYNDTTMTTYDDYLLYIDGIDTSEWNCVEWENKTEIDKTYIDDCCISNIRNASYIKYEQNNEDMIYMGSSMCITGSSEIESYTIGNTTINLNNCKNRTLYIETNETWCVTKERIGD